METIPRIVAAAYKYAPFSDWTGTASTGSDATIETVSGGSEYEESLHRDDGSIRPSKRKRGCSPVENNLNTELKKW